MAWVASHGVFLFVLLAAMAYAYWPTLQWVAENWIREPDYSHGWIVLPLALSIALARRDSFPGISSGGVCWSGLWLVGFAIAVRVVGRLIYADFMDAWSFVFLIGGCVWVVFGRAALVWSIPAIAFLFFAIPIPYQAESLLSFQLQGVATAISTAGLRVIGQPAVAEGHLIWVGAEKLNIEPACSGLRIFVGLMATAYYFAAVSARNWGDRLVLILSVIPVALVANSTRIVATGWLYQWTQSADLRHAIHDYSGLLMIPLGFALMYAVYWYWSTVYRPLEQVVARDFLQPA
ncbi:exosortase/archaeosortase family protein [Rubripirellula lacrimiformis]|nr:exosortase/archaeosortase family protein [Rubripirellula lacrimiformis]